MKKILLIEDNVSNHHLIIRFLTKDGYEITACLTCTESLAVLEAGSFDLVITDYGLPDDNGIELAKKIRLHENYKEIPIILLTAGTFDAEEKIQNGHCTNAVLRKPIDFPLLRKTVAELI